MSQKRFGVLSHASSINVGDLIQTIAAARLLRDENKSYECFIDRDTAEVLSLNGPGGGTTNEPISCVYNGWFDSSYMQSWPPPAHIDPLFLSFHLNDVPKTRDYDRLQSYADEARPSVVDPRFHPYYRENGPIGCRDNHTVRLFRDAGIDNAYFSGCLTMTLDGAGSPTSVAPTDMERSGMFVVDVSTKNVLPEEVKQLAEFVTHVFPERNPGCSTLDYERSKFAKAETLLQVYSTAKLVWTSRLHCVLPCIAAGTPVIFVDHGLEDDVRFDGLYEFIPIWEKDVKQWQDHVNEDEGKGKNRNWRDLTSEMRRRAISWIHQ